MTPSAPACAQMDRRGLAKRYLRPDSVEELTSRMSATDIPQILDRLETAFDPAEQRAEGTKRRQKRAQCRSTCCWRPT